MSFASAERAYLTPPEPFECDECEDGPGCTCEEDAREAWEDGKEQAAIDREEMRREDELLDGPEPGWEP